MFFEKEENSNTIRTLLSVLSSQDTKAMLKTQFNVTKEFFDLLYDSLAIIKEISNNPSIWDSLVIPGTKNLTEFIGICKYFGNLNDVATDLQNPIEVLYQCSLRILFEADFKLCLQPKFSELFENSTFEKIKINASHNSKNLNYSANLRRGIDELIFSVPYDVCKSFFNSEEIERFSKFDEKKKEASQTLQQIQEYSDNLNIQITELDNKLEVRQVKVDKLEETLKKQQSRLNFAGLSEGFYNLLIQKSSEAESLYKWLVSMGIIMVIPLICIIFGWLPDSILKENTSLNYVIKIVPFISLEIILIYFFRVILQNYKSVKAQVLQIELRRTLCQFIESYTDYSNDVKGDKETNPLEKFENLIFSGIISDSENLPSTFDGMDQITKLLTSLKGK
tara:strand:- start:4725 stop:5903 length:1179 start_codon:yes stop_codon:yes gene_type:complete